MARDIKRIILYAVEWDREAIVAKLARIRAQTTRTRVCNMIFHARTELNTFTTTPIKITAREGYLLLNKLFKFGYVCVVKRNKNKLARSVVSKRCDDTFHCRKKNNGHFTKNRRKLWKQKCSWDKENHRTDCNRMTKNVDREFFFYRLHYVFTLQRIAKKRFCCQYTSSPRSKYYEKIHKLCEHTI